MKSKGMERLRSKWMRTITRDPEFGDATGGTELGYSPPANYHGNVSFEVAIEDDKGASTAITVNVEVKSVEDTPVIDQGNSEIVVTMTVNGDPVPFVAPTLSATDGDGDTLTWSVLNYVQYPARDDTYATYTTLGTVSGQISWVRIRSPWSSPTPMAIATAS